MGYVKVRDSTKPVCHLIGTKTVPHEAGFPYTDKGVSCSDGLDGVIPGTKTGTVNWKKVGTYTLTYTATDSNGNEAIKVTRHVQVRDILKPVIGLKYKSDGKYFHVGSSEDTAPLHDGTVVSNPAGK